MDHYKTLGVDRNATQEDIKKAYRQLAMQYHPDRNPGDKEAEQKFKEVQSAYDVLSDTVQKARYDAGSGPRQTGNPFYHHHHAWGSVFTNNPAPVERGRNIQVNVDVELKDVVAGVSKNIVIPKRERCSICNCNGYTEYKPCPTCHGSGKTAIKQSPFNIWMGCTACGGTGRSGVINCNACSGHGFINSGQLEISVNIPAGVDTGHQLRLNGYGEPAKKPEGKPGDLILVIVVKEHPLFKRSGVNISYEYPIGYAELCLGGTIEIPTLGGVAVLTIPPNTHDYTQFRLRGMGLPYFHGGKGDLIVIAKLSMPSPEVINSNKELLNSIAQFEKEYLAKERQKFKPKGE
jgi:molecular chaperone DnaJ